MADKTIRVAINVPGPFYVDENCINCGACVEIAPEHFALSDELGVSYVICQPSSAAQRQLCSQAMTECPVDAIGDDGE